MLVAQKVRLYPTKEQITKISFQFGASRYVYNRALALKINAYKRFNINIGKYNLISHITKLKKAEKTSWLKDADSQSLQVSISNMDLAYKHFFEGGGYPKFKSKHASKQSYQYPQRVKIEGGKVYLPKVGWVKARGIRTDYAGKIKTVTVSLEAGQYHASVLMDIEAEPIRLNRKPIGLDVGVRLIVADSNGNMVKSLNLTRELIKLRRRHQELSRKKKGSSNRHKAKEKLSKQNLRIVNMRKDFLHKLSARYSENQVIVEELKIKNMSKSAKGTIEKPGKNVAQKRGLNRSIMQQSWGMFFEMLKYKTNGNLIKVPPQYTSQACNKCGHISKDNRQSQSKFVCTSCGHTANADINAAKNILDLGMQGNNASLKIAS